MMRPMHRRATARVKAVRGWNADLMIVGDAPLPVVNAVVNYEMKHPEDDKRCNLAEGDLVIVEFFNSDYLPVVLCRVKARAVEAFYHGELDDTRDKEDELVQADSAAAPPAQPTTAAPPAAFSSPDEAKAASSARQEPVETTDTGNQASYNEDATDDTGEDQDAKEVPEWVQKLKDRVDQSLRAVNSDGNTARKEWGS